MSLTAGASMPEILVGDARALPLADESVDLIVTSPPYFGLRDYGIDGQLGAEPSPAEFIAALIECTAEMVRVLKPSGSIFVNLGDKYSGGQGGPSNLAKWSAQNARGGAQKTDTAKQRTGRVPGFPQKSLMLLPERYRIAAVDQLGLIARAVIVWSKPNGLPESVTDRVRRSHEDWVHLTKQPRYFASVDEIREPHAEFLANGKPSPRAKYGGLLPSEAAGKQSSKVGSDGDDNRRADWVPRVNPLGKLPGSVWTIPTQPLRVPAELGIDHFAAFPMEWPRRLIQGWCPREVCTACGEGRRPVVDKVTGLSLDGRKRPARDNAATWSETACADNSWGGDRSFARGVGALITGYACACPDTSAPSTPGVVLDPFGGTGTTAIVACALGRRGISIDLNPDYRRLAEWRAADPKQRAKASGDAAQVRGRDVPVGDAGDGAARVGDVPELVAGGVEGACDHAPVAVGDHSVDGVVGADLQIAHTPTVTRHCHFTEEAAT